MATSFGALCTDFYVNHKLALKMDLPGDRDTILHFFDRVRSQQPAMNRFKRYSDELALETGRRDGAYRWVALRQNSIRSGQVNPETLEESYELHRLILKLSPTHLSLSPVDVDYQEVLFGFDLEAQTNQNETILEALFADSPLMKMLDQMQATPMDVQPVFGIALDSRCDLQAYFEVKTQTTPAQIRRGRYRAEPISVLLTIRKMGPVAQIEDLLPQFEMLRSHAERLADEQVVPNLLTPIRCVIKSGA